MELYRKDVLQDFLRNVLMEGIEEIFSILLCLKASIERKVSTCRVSLV